MQRLLAQQNKVEIALSDLSSQQKVQQQQIVNSEGELQQLNSQKQAMAAQVQQLVQNSQVAQAIFANFTDKEKDRETDKETEHTELSEVNNTAEVMVALNQAILDRQNKQLTLKQAMQLAQRFHVIAQEHQTLSLQQINDKQQLNSTDEELAQLRQRYSANNQQKKDVETLQIGRASCRERV